MTSQYSTLMSYNGNSFQGIRPPVPSTYLSGSFIVPAYGAPGYATLQHGIETPPSGYFNIGQAYGQGASNYQTQYMTSSCN
jgi:hypothetical protein